ncbi:MAG: hypothetical protein O2854_01335 [Chloroflexi bacterium]|nr:hypothetical protein [Chloroflexota bacterium]
MQYGQTTVLGMGLLLGVVAACGDVPAAAVPSTAVIRVDATGTAVVPTLTEQLFSTPAATEGTPYIPPATATAAGSPGATQTPTATVIPTTTAIPVPTPSPTPDVEECRRPYEAAVINGPTGPAPPADGDRVFRSLTVDPTNADVLVLGTERNGFVRSEDGGVTWTRHRDGFRSLLDGYPEVWDADISRSNPQVVMAATLNSPGPPTGGFGEPGFYVSRDGGRTWSQSNCGFTTSRAVSVRMDASDPDVAVVGLEGGFPSFQGDTTYYPGGIFRTVDGGENWTRIELGDGDGENGFWHMYALATEPATFITFGNGVGDLELNLGFLRSRDAGATWEFFAPEMRPRPIADFAVSADGTHFYVNERDTYFGWVSTDSGATWSQSAVWQVNGPIAVSPANPKLVVFASPWDVRRSTDGLATVNAVLETPSAIRDIVFAPSNPNVVYAELDGYVLYRSDDAGLTWRLVANIRNDVLNAQP